MSWRNIHHLIFVCCLMASVSTMGQKLSVETMLDTHRIVLGDQIYLSYIIEKESDISLRLPAISDTLTKGVEVLEPPLIDSAKLDNDSWRISMKMLITSFDTGIYYLPPQPIAFRDDYRSDTLFTRPTYLEVYGVAIDTTQTVRDIKAPARVPVGLVEVLTYLIPILLLAALVYIIIVYLLPGKKKRPSMRPLKPEEPAYITAFRELDRLKAQKLWQQKQVKEYYTRITHIIRWYIGKRFGIKALEQTSDEILEHIKSLSLDDINYTNLARLLNLADLVKFARGEPDPEENISHLENAYDFLKKTKDDQTEYTPDKKETE